MARTSTRDRAGFSCSECGWSTARWVGRCGECQAWGTVSEVGTPKAKSMLPGKVTAAARPITEIGLEVATAAPTGLSELDRVLGGGLVPGAAVLLAGEPGVGKSTLLLHVAALAARRGPVLYVTGEESAAQVRLRAERLGTLHTQLYLAAETELGAVVAHLEQLQPQLLIVDSVQTVAAADIDGAPGGVAQVKEVAGALIRLAKLRAMTTVLVGHVTKEGSVAGPRMLEHLVDTVLSFEGERSSSLRLLRATKNRFGATDEVSCFEQSDTGLRQVVDPSEMFRSHRSQPIPGTCLTVTVEGRRPMLAEIQGLAAAGSNNPRRGVSGLDSARVAMLLAVAQRSGGFSLSSADVFVATVGGVKLTDPGTDLAVCLAIASAVWDQAIPADVLVIGEVALSGDIRPVPMLGQRIAEAVRLGFRRVLVPPGAGAKLSGLGAVPAGVTIREVEHLDEVMRTLYKYSQSSPAPNRVSHIRAVT